MWDAIPCNCVLGCCLQACKEGVGNADRGDRSCKVFRSVIEDYTPWLVVR